MDERLKRLQSKRALFEILYKILGNKWIDIIFVSLVFILGTNLSCILMKLFNDSIAIFAIGEVISLGLSVIFDKLSIKVSKNIFSKKETLNEQIRNLEDDNKQKRPESEIKKSVVLKEKNITISKNTKESEEENIKAQIFITFSRNTGIIKEKLTSEWEQYLKDTLTDDSQITFIRELCYKLILLNTIFSLEIVIEDLNNNKEMIDLLVHFGKRGEELRKFLGLPQENRSRTSLK